MMLVLLLACSPFSGVEDRWNAAWRACDPDAVEVAPDPYDLEATLSSGCAEQLLSDFKVDAESLRSAPSSDTSPPLDACFAVSAYTLLTRDSGPFDPAGAEGVYAVLPDQMGEVLREIGGDETRKLTYNYAAWFIGGVVLDEALTGGALAQTRADGLHLSPDIADECGLELAHVLFHEAGHAVLEGHVACPDDPDAACDADDQGTFALERSLVALWRAECADAEDPECLYLDQELDALEPLILTDG